MPLPPRWIRRALTGPLVLALAVLLVTTLPLWLIVAAALSPLVPGWLRPLRLTWIVTVYLVWDAAALVALFGLWVASGFGWAIKTPRFVRWHYVLTARLLQVLFMQVRWALRLRVEVRGDDVDTGLPGRPIIVASRHAGPGDSIILVDALINRFDREPRIVLKDTLQWDPAIDVMLNRLPNRFIAPPSPWDRSVKAGRSTDLIEEIAELAAGLDRDDALLIFPEGGNFTPRRRLRAIERLRDTGLLQFGDRAERMRHVLAPKPGGLLAAITAAPDAGVAFVAHTGLDRMVTVADVWRELPMDKVLVMQVWVVPPAEIPATTDEQVDWLYGWWERIDAWIEENRPLERTR